jgi:serine protease Do
MFAPFIALCAAHPLLADSAADSASGNESYEILRASQEVFRSVAEQLRPSLVRIETVGGTQPGAAGTSPGGDPDDPRQPTPFVDRPGSGFVVADGPTTGIVYSADGYIITSSFNFVRDPALISVVLADGRRLVADLIARDHVRKIALLRVDANDLQPPEWARRRDIQVGEFAVALGLAFDAEHPSIAVGTVSALDRMRGHAVQTDAKLSPANYGGPLADIHGRVIGICVPMAQRPGELAGVEFYDAGIGFALPKHHVDAIVDTLAEGESFYRGWLGIQVDLRSSDGLIVTNIADPSPSREAGLRPGDKIISADGHRIRHFGQLIQTLYMVPAGETVTLCVERDNELIEMNVTLARNTELGYLPPPDEEFDATTPIPDQGDEEEDN